MPSGPDPGRGYETARSRRRRIAPSSGKRRNGALRRGAATRRDLREEQCGMITFSRTAASRKAAVLPPAYRNTLFRCGARRLLAEHCGGRVGHHRAFEEIRVLCAPQTHGIGEGEVAEVVG